MNQLQPDERGPNDLAQALGAIHRAQILWLADLDQVSHGDPSFIDAFRRWQEQLTALSLHYLRAENRLLHYLMAPLKGRVWKESSAPVGDRLAIAQRWTSRLTVYFQSVHVDTTYLRLPSALEPGEEPMIADVITDIVALAETAEATMPALARLANGADLDAIEDTAFYRVLSPWKQRAHPAAHDVLRWLAEVLREHDEL